MSNRAQLISSIREFADWLEAHPEVDPPSHPRFLLPLHSNAAVTDFAAEHDLAVTADAEGNLSARLTFGSVQYEVYGYVDFEAHREAMAARDAQAWADRNNLAITPRTN